VNSIRQNLNRRKQNPIEGKTSVDKQHELSEEFAF
uniref:Transposase n=1 Tax=Globodera pallida TaxID=36090 RepID=A0A183CTI8_GLOPA